MDKSTRQIEKSILKNAVKNTSHRTLQRSFNVSGGDVYIVAHRFGNMFTSTLWRMDKSTRQIVKKAF